MKNERSTKKISIAFYTTLQKNVGEKNKQLYYSTRIIRYPPEYTKCLGGCLTGLNDKPTKTYLEKDSW
jgi:hypothetical protein